MNGIVMAFLSWLLQRANAKPPAMAREAFFAMKDRLLRRYGQAVGTDLQHIALKCWSCDGSGTYDHSGQTCFKCEGTGTYREFWVMLQRYRLGSRVFHRPLGKSIIRPSARPTIEGHVRHPERFKRWARPAQLALALLFDWSLFRVLLPSLRPRWVWVWKVRLAPKRCHRCGRRYLSAWSRSCYFCARCRWVRNHEVAEVPF
jgi:hypothetical protein